MNIAKVTIQFDKSGCPVEDTINRQERKLKAQQAEIDELREKLEKIQVETSKK